MDAYPQRSYPSPIERTDTAHEALPQTPLFAMRSCRRQDGFMSNSHFRVPSQHNFALTVAPGRAAFLL